MFTGFFEDNWQTLHATGGLTFVYNCWNVTPAFVVPLFDEPDRFDVKRADAKNHVAFGFGNHFCVGAALARQEMLSSFTMLLDRLHDIELAEPLPVPAHEPSFFLRPMKRLPLRFRADSGADPVIGEG